MPYDVVVVVALYPQLVDVFIPIETLLYKELRAESRKSNLNHLLICNLDYSN